MPDRDHAETPQSIERLNDMHAIRLSKCSISSGKVRNENTKKS